MLRRIPSINVMAYTVDLSCAIRNGLETSSNASKYLRENKSTEELVVSLVRLLQQTFLFRENLSLCRLSDCLIKGLCDFGLDWIEALKKSFVSDQIKTNLYIAMSK